MAEQLIEQPMQGATAEVITPIHDAPETFGGRLRARLAQGGREALTLLDTSAGVALAKGDIRYAESNMHALDTRFDGMLERQSAGDAVSMALEADMLLDFRLAAQRAGYTNVDEMPADARTATAETAIQARMADIIDALQIQHADWTTEELATVGAQQVRDLAARFAMTTEQRDDYNAAMLQYQNHRAELPGLQQELAELRAQRSERTRRLGNLAVKGLVSMGTAMRKLPHELGARAAVAGQSAAQLVGNWYRGLESKKAVRYTVIGVALSGLASYVAMRFSMGAGPQSADYVHAANVDDLSTGPFGNTTEGAFSGTVQGEAFAAPNTGTAFGANVQGESFAAPAQEAHNVFGGPVKGESFGTQAGEPFGVVQGEPFGNASGEPFGQPAPEAGGFKGADLSGAETTTELFGKGRVKQWPDTIRVSAWDSKTKDGSLWGISTEMLERSGVKNPSDAQIDELVDALRPQAQPNGHLREGQKLDLRPALKALNSII